MKSMINQLLSAEGLSIKWANTILTTVRKISQVVRPDVRHEGDDMDIRQYVQIKKVTYVNGSNMIVYVILLYGIYVCFIKKLCE